MQIVYGFNSYFFSKMLKTTSIIRRNGLHLHPFHSTLLSFTYYTVSCSQSGQHTAKCGHINVRPPPTVAAQKPRILDPNNFITGPDVFAVIILTSRNDENYTSILVQTHHHRVI